MQPELIRVRWMNRAFACVLAACSIVLPCGIASAEDAPPRPDLAGTVFDDSGAPLREATVFLYTAGPRTGTSTFCPSCYPDCRKQAMTDRNGHFRIESLDPKLVFRLLVVAADYKPEFLRGVDPQAGSVEVALEKLDRSRVGPKQCLRGRVVDPEGQPIFGAAVNFDSYFFEDGTGRGGECEGVDQVAVTDHDGRFLLSTEQKFETMTVSVEARGFARRKFFRLARTKTHELKLTEGAMVTGRLVKAGKPLKRISVGLVSVDRSENFTGNFEVGTDAEGRFLFVNVPPYQQYYVYGLMERLRGLGCTPVKRIRVGPDGETKEAGDLGVVPGLRLSGRVILSDGEPVSPITRLGIYRQEAWDSISIELDDEGRFEAANLPPESYSISVRIPGYTISVKNKSLDRLNGNSLIGTLEKDTSLLILLEPGDFKSPDLRRGVPPTEDARAEDKPLQGTLERP